MTMDTSTLVSAVTGIFLPLAISAILGRNAARSFKAVVAFVACVVAALVVTVLTDGWQTFQAHTGNDMAKLILVNVLTLLLTAWSFYSRLFKPMQLTDALEQRGPQLGSDGSPDGSARRA